MRGVAHRSTRDRGFPQDVAQSKGLRHLRQQILMTPRHHPGFGPAKARGWVHVLGVGPHEALVVVEVPGLKQSVFRTQRGD